jgi:hypothetical protein
VPDPIACAACGTPAPHAVVADDLYVCAACLRLHVELAAPPSEPEAPAPMAKREPPNPFPVAPGPVQHSAQWGEVASGYRRLRNAMAVTLIGVPAAVGFRFILLHEASRSSRYNADTSATDIGSCAFLLVVGIALLMFFGGVIALKNKPKGKRGRDVALALCVFAFVPVVNLIAFPVLFVIYTALVGADTGMRTVRRSAWVLIGCAVVLTPSVAALVASVAYVVIDLVFVHMGWQFKPPPTRPDPNPTLPSSGVLFGVTAGFVLWLGAYVVTMMTLSGVARAVEMHSQKSTTPDAPSADFEYVTDANP